MRREVTKGLLSRYIGCLGCGYNRGSKLKLMVILALAFANRIILNKVPYNIRKVIIKPADWLSHSVVTNIDGLKFRMVDFDSCYIYTPLFEVWAWDYLQVKVGDVFIDVGAHLGRYTLPIARAVGEKGLVIAIEPDIENYNCLMENIKSNNLRNIVTVNIAAWSEDRELKLYPGESSAGRSIMGRAGNNCRKVNGRSLDNLLEETDNKRKVDWIKIDVESAELEVIEGLNKTLARSSPKLLVEVGSKNSKAFEHRMNTLNYKYYIIPESKRGVLGNPIPPYYYCWR